MKKTTLKRFSVALISLGLMMSTEVFAEDSALPAEPQQQSRATESVQPEVDKQSTGARRRTSAKRFSPRQLLLWVRRQTR
ncbi:MAG: hypothetical protein LJE70_18575 [Chromatiaceae bacterium]|nr:hypothetical protein [Chromatiaceae bacterium]